MSLENLTGLMTAAVKPYRKAPNAPDISCRPAKLLGTFFLAAATAMAATACVSAATLPLPAATAAVPSTATVMAASVPVAPTMPVPAVVEVMSTAPASTDVDAAAVDRRISVIVRRRVACFVGVGVSVGVGISVARRDGTAA